eukprot:TRINITY_DN3436_c0_g1_i1.p2 TRINITY_DN3436_c0_g1~~TRINITY_DN3436_c0_g1_i1.p2  ORF type:complete len:119 (+),score=10.73 TRINITY_DN3436_c0_g1_i1:202-558(+)
MDFSQGIADMLTVKMSSAAKDHNYEAKPLYVGWADKGDKKSFADGGPLGREGCAALCNERGRGLGEFAAVKFPQGSSTDSPEANFVYEMCFMSNSPIEDVKAKSRSLAPHFMGMFGKK